MNKKQKWGFIGGAVALLAGIAGIVFGVKNSKHECLEYHDNENDGITNDPDFTVVDPGNAEPTEE